MGPSGCGKTTMLNCLSGLDDIDSGQVTIDGVVLHDLPDDERSDYRARNMGFVFQLYNLLPVLSSVENVEMPLLLSGVRRRRKPGAARWRCWSRWDWPTAPATLPSELSGGQRQRVTIARALINQPSIIWADEPTGDLDSETTDEIMDLLLELNRANNQSFILVTHSLEVGRLAHQNRPDARRLRCRHRFRLPGNPEGVATSRNAIHHRRRHQPTHSYLTGSNHPVGRRRFRLQLAASRVVSRD